MRTIAIFIFTILIGFVASAQPNETFITSFDPNPLNKFQADKGYSIWSIGKYVYVLSGFVNYDLGGRKNQIFMVDADTRQVVEQIEFEGPQGDMAVTAYWVTSDQHILLTGEWLDKNSAFTMRMFLAKLTPNLEIVWINYYPDLTANYLYSEGIAETEEGDYIIYLMDAPPPAPHTKGELRVIKTDTSGTVLLSKMLVDTFTLTVGYGDLTPIDDSHFLISSLAKGYYYHPVLGTYLNIAVLHKIDTDANQVWTKTLNYAKIDNQPPHSTSLTGGGGVAVWMKDTITNDPEIAWNFILMYGIDDNGNHTWTREWNKRPYRIITRIKQADNGDVLGAGFYDSGGWPNKGKGWLFRTTNTGELIWERHYSDSLLRPWSPQLELLDLCEMADGRIAATGIVFDSNGVAEPWNPNVVLLVIDADGCLEPGCTGQTQYVTSLLEPIFKLPDLPILGISPNPAAGPVFISLPETFASSSRAYELRCYAPNGQLLKRFDWPSGTPSLRIDDWKADGICYLFLFDQRGYPIASGKMIFHR